MKRCGIWLGLLMLARASDDTCYLELRHEAKVMKTDDKSAEKSHKCECSDADKNLFHQWGDGNQPGSFNEGVAQCERRSISPWAGFSAGQLSTCLRFNMGLTTPCANCFSIHGQFAAQNCKAQCTMRSRSWCSKSCLKCKEESLKDLRECVGVELPSAPACD